jgi:hypothetical protein
MYMLEAEIAQNVLGWNKYLGLKWNKFKGNLKGIIYEMTKLMFWLNE